MKHRFIIKCYKCGAKYEGESIADTAQKNNLTRDAKGYYCNCKKIIADKFIKAQVKPDEKK